MDNNRRHPIFDIESDRWISPEDREYERLEREREMRNLPEQRTSKPPPPPRQQSTEPQAGSFQGDLSKKRKKNVQNKKLGV
jgi:hypothetical protein